LGLLGTQFQMVPSKVLGGHELNIISSR